MTPLDFLYAAGAAWCAAAFAGLLLPRTAAGLRACCALSALGGAAAAADGGWSLLEWPADPVRPVQPGDVNLYLPYVFAVILLAYLLGAV